MKRVLFCAFLCILIIGNVSALNLTKTVVAATQQIIVKPSVHVTFQPSATHTLDINEAIITFESTPPGAYIYLGGTPLDELTPFTYKVGVAPYTIPITISYSGYQDYHQNLSIMGRQTYTVSAVLIPITAAPTSQPVVSETLATQSDSIPTNAPVTTQQGVSQTPATPTNTFPANTPATLQQVQAQPTSSGSTGSLSVTSTPAGAEVSVDNEVKGITPAMISGLSTGTHTLKITKEGYRDFSTNISIDAGQVREYSTGLTAVAKSPGFAVVSAIAAVFCLALVRKRSR
jgi:hypothetical protein